MIWENLRIALKAIRANKMRSVLTTLGIIIGVAAVIAVVSIVQGLNYMISNELQGVGATYIVVAPKDDRNDPDMIGRDITLTYEDGLAVMSHSTALAYFNPIFKRLELLRYRDEKHRCMLLAVGAHYQEVDNHWVDEGRFFSQLDLERHAHVCLVGRKVIDELKLGETPIGTEIIVGNASFTIVGLMEKKGEMFGQDRDDLIIIPITTARDLFGNEAMKRLILEFQATSPETIDLAKDQITVTLRKRHHLRRGIKDDFKVILQEEILKTTGSILGSVTKVVGAIVGIALLVGGIGIMNIMLVSVTERTREIGIRKAVGARRSDIMVQFLIEAVTLSLFGGLVGILVGWGFGILGAKAIPGFPSAHVPLWAVLLGFGFAALTGIVFGVYPAAKASSLDPIEALRYE